MLAAATRAHQASLEGGFAGSGSGSKTGSVPGSNSNGASAAMADAQREQPLIGRAKQPAGRPDAPCGGMAADGVPSASASQPLLQQQAGQALHGHRASPAPAAAGSPQPLHAAAAAPAAHPHHHHSPSILRQTEAALGLWNQLHETASTPSTVLAPLQRPPPRAAQSTSTDQSAA